jgi:hypothetical protein
MFARWFRSKPARDVTVSPSPVISSKPLTLLTGFLGSGKTTHRCGGRRHHLSLERVRRGFCCGGVGRLVLLVGLSICPALVKTSTSEDLLRRTLIVTLKAL